MRLGKHSTAEEALFRGRTEDRAPAAAPLAGKNVIVTGASTGLGAETARVLAAGGARVLGASRARAGAEPGALRLRSASWPALRSASWPALALDLADLSSVRRFAEAFLATGEPLHVLVNNAGVMATPLATTRQQIELQLGTNHAGHFFLTNLLRPALERAGTEDAPARIVTVSSSLHRRGRGERLLATLGEDRAYTRRPYVPLDAYADSKLANVLFTVRLAELLPRSVGAFALHPGVIPTQLTRSMGFAGAVFRTLAGAFTKTVAQGAATSVYAATAPELDGRSGDYLEDCAVARAARAGRDAALAKDVWEATERFVSAF